MRRKIILSFTLIAAFIITGCSSNGNDANSSLNITGSMELEYASQFTVDYCDGGYSIVNILDGNKYILIPEGKKVPENIGEDITVINTPIDNIYLAASSAMDLFLQLDSMDKVLMTSTKESDWSIPEIKEMVGNDDITYIGKYNAPDFEYLISENCDIAIESTMIYHSPQIKEQLESSGIPVMIERSSYESHPLGRMEWIKLYGLLLGKEQEAADIFHEKCNVLKDIKIPDNDSQKKTVAFFYISSNGYANVRKPDDYICEMIRMAGGEYIFTAEDLKTEENALSTMNMQMEAFYEKAKDADIIIYNSAIDGGISNVSQLLEKSSLLSDFKAVQEGNVWCTEKNVFQKTTGAGDMIADLNKIINNSDTDKLTYIYKLK